MARARTQKVSEILLIDTTHSYFWHIAAKRAPGQCPAMSTIAIGEGFISQSCISRANLGLQLLFRDRERAE